LFGTPEDFLAQARDFIWALPESLSLAAGIPADGKPIEIVIRLGEDSFGSSPNRMGWKRPRMNGTLE
jgi:hypothetical protein